MNGHNQPSQNADFEESLRHILTPGPMPVGGGPSARAADGAEREADGAEREADGAEREAKAARRFIETVSRAEEERKKLFWFKLMRPIAFLALIGLLAMFVYRITTFGTQ